MGCWVGAAEPLLVILQPCGSFLGSLLQDDKDKRVRPSDLPLSLVLHAGGVEHMECEIKLEGPASPDAEPGKEETEESKKRKRKPYRPGMALEWGCGAVKTTCQVSLVASRS